MASKKLDTLFEEILDERWKESPVYATYMGIHNYDHLLANIGKDTRRFSRQKDKRYYQRLKEFEKDDTISKEQNIDLKLLLDRYEIGFYLEDILKPFERNPSIVLNIAMGALHIFMIRDFAPIPVKLENMLSRLRQIPQLVDEGKANLKFGENIPSIWVDIAIEQIKDGIGLFNTVIPAYGKQFPIISTEIEKECQIVKDALINYKNFLIEEILPKAKGSYAVGKEVYNYLIHKKYQMPYNADELREIGEKIRKDTEKQLDSLAYKISPGKSWIEVIENLKVNFPPKEKIKDYYREEISRLRKFLIDNDIVDIPEGESLSIRDTPSFQRAIIPYAIYNPPAPFEDTQVGNFYITPINTKLPQDKQKEQLEGHNRYKAIITAIHEGYPGHHLQLVYANKVPSKIRRLSMDTVFAEGWALYCEEMMQETGYISDPRVSIYQLKDQLWRACRVIIDVGIHTDNMKFDEAVDILVNVVRLGQINAISEVKRYTKMPTQPMCYTMGKLLIKRLKEDYQKKMGDKFNLKDFHNKLLSFGSLPVKIICDEMLDQ